MAKHILIDSGLGLIRTALTVNGKLVDYYEESPDQGRSKGNIYKGIIKKVDPHIQAAFVRYGSGRDGFLPLRDVPFRSGDEAKSDQGGGTRKKAALGPGDAVVVQVVKDEVGGKGAALTTKLSLSGRYLVYMPDSDGDGGVSSRLSEEERAAMKKALSELRIPDGAAVILRTAALNHPTEELQADLDRLLESHRAIEEKAYDQKEPGLLFQEAQPAYRYLREYYLPDVERIWVNENEVLEQCRGFFELYEPRSADKVSLSKDGPLMFQRLGVETEVERLSSRKVTLPSGANFVIDQAEALVAIDVNSAKSKGEVPTNAKEGRGGRAGREDRGGDRRTSKDLEETVFAINMEAAAEIARQLRLRDLGGIIVVDFIDMEEDRHRRKVEEAMRRALSQDKAKIKVYDISPLGLMQISRQRLRKAGPLFSKTSCEACQGRGWHASAASASLAVLRRLEDRVQGSNGRSLTVTVPFPVANHLMNDFRSHVLDLETRHGVAVRILADANASGEAVFLASPIPVTAEVPASGPNRVAAQAGNRQEGGGRKDRGRGRELERSGRDRQDGRRRGKEGGGPPQRPDAARIPETPLEIIATEITQENIPGGQAWMDGAFEPARAIKGIEAAPLAEIRAEPSRQAHAVPVEPGSAEASGSSGASTRDIGGRTGRRGRGRRGRGGPAQNGTGVQAPREGRGPRDGQLGSGGKGPLEAPGPKETSVRPVGPSQPIGRQDVSRRPVSSRPVAPRSAQPIQPAQPAQPVQPERPARPVVPKAREAASVPQGPGRRDVKMKDGGRPQGRVQEKKAEVRPVGKGPKGKGTSVQSGAKTGRRSRPEPAPAPAARGAAPKAPRKGPIEY